MNNKMLKVVGAIVFTCLVLLVIYRPEPGSRRFKNRPPVKVIGTKYLKLANQAISKAHDANEIALEELSQLADGEEIDLVPFAAAKTAAIDALAEADESIKRCNEKLQNFDQEETSSSILIEANIKLIASLSEMSEVVKTLNSEVQHLKKEDAQSLLQAAKNVKEAIRQLTDATVKALNTLDKTLDAYSEYFQLD